MLSRLDDAERTQSTMEVCVATALHEAWRAGLATADTADSEGGTAAVVTHVREVEGVSYDLASLPYEELPMHYRKDNLLAAHGACESIREAVAELEVGARGGEVRRYLRSDAFVDDAAAKQHERWLVRNRARLASSETATAVAEALPDASCVAFDDLDEDGKDKNRALVRTAVALFCP